MTDGSIWKYGDDLPINIKFIFFILIMCSLEISHLLHARGPITLPAPITPHYGIVSSGHISVVRSATARSY